MVFTPLKKLAEKIENSWYRFLTACFSPYVEFLRLQTKMLPSRFKFVIQLIALDRPYCLFREARKLLLYPFA